MRDLNELTISKLESQFSGGHFRAMIQTGNPIKNPSDGSKDGQLFDDCSLRAGML